MVETLFFTIRLWFTPCHCAITLVYTLPIGRQILEKPEMFLQQSLALILFGNFRSGGRISFATLPDLMESTCISNVSMDLNLTEAEAR